MCTLDTKVNCPCKVCKCRNDDTSQHIMKEKGSIIDNTPCSMVSVKDSITSSSCKGVSSHQKMVRHKFFIQKFSLQVTLGCLALQVTLGFSRLFSTLGYSRLLQAFYHNPPQQSRLLMQTPQNPKVPSMSEFTIRQKFAKKAKYMQ